MLTISLGHTSFSVNHIKTCLNRTSALYDLCVMGAPRATKVAYHGRKQKMYYDVLT